MSDPTLSHRPLRDEDIPAICGFPASLEEVSFMFRNPTYPLQPDRLRTALREREASTVVLVDGSVAGLANFYDCKRGERCSIGNVIVDPKRRGIGVARYLIETMSDIAARDYHARHVTLVCFNRNVGGLLLYTKLGFEPYAIEAREDLAGKRIAAIRMRLSLEDRR